MLHAPVTTRLPLLVLVMADFALPVARSVAAVTTHPASIERLTASSSSPTTVTLELSMTRLFSTGVHVYASPPVNVHAPVV